MKQGSEPRISVEVPFPIAPTETGPGSLPSEGSKRKIEPNPNFSLLSGRKPELDSPADTKPVKRTN